jgi:2-oxo-3-hexenedioate decarboxylase
MSVPHDVAAIAGRLIAAYDRATKIPPITQADPGFDVPAAYEVLREIENRRRIVQGWEPVGRKIGFTNTTIWSRYGVHQPMWAHVWAHSVRYAKNGHATLGLKPFVQPRIEPEVVFRLRAGVAPTSDPLAALRCVEWIAPGFEIVQCHFPDWKFTAADCTAAFGLHGALIVGTPIPVTNRNRAALAAALPTFALTLRRGRTVVERGVGSNVLGGPAHALAHLARLLAAQPQFAPLAAGEIVTTGTVTDAWPVAPGQTWSSDYGALGIGGVTVTFT